MEIKIHQTIKDPVAEIISDEIVIRDTDDVLDLMAEARLLGANSVILYENQITAGFFDLKTKMAGEILQKFSNYRMQLAIAGDFSKYGSRSLRDFITESNRGNRIFFTENLDEALKKLSDK